MEHLGSGSGGNSIFQSLSTPGEFVYCKETLEDNAGVCFYWLHLNMHLFLCFICFLYLFLFFFCIWLMRIRTQYLMTMLTLFWFVFNLFFLLCFHLVSVDLTCSTEVSIAPWALSPSIPPSKSTDSEENVQSLLVKFVCWSGFQENVPPPNLAADEEVKECSRFRSGM